MFTGPGPFSKAALYYAIAFALCIAVTLTPMLDDRVLNVVMFTPLASVLLMLLVVTRDGYKTAGWIVLGLHRAGVSGWGLALLLPPLVLSFAYGCVWLSGIGAFVVPDNMASLPFYLFDLIASIIIVAVFGAFGEEIGWRGYLLPNLLGLGAGPAMLVSGLLHGVWHLPVIILTPFYHGGGNLLIIIPLFLLTLTLAGICYGHLRLTTSSIWPAALAHSGFNIFWERFNSFTNTSSPLALEYLAGESGVLTLAALAIVAGWFAYRLNENDRGAMRG